MSDITISVIQPPSTTINVGVDETTLIQAGIGLPPHSVTHISGGSDEVNHNLLGGLQGGSGGQYYHLSSGQYFNLITGTGSFYPNSNPSGFITGVDLTPYATVTYVTGISGQLQAQITVLNNQTGSFYPRTNPSGFITGVNLSSYATINYVSGISGGLQSQITNLNNSTGSYVLTNQTGQFYSSNNPSGYVSTGYVTGISGNLQQQITTLTNQTGSFYPNSNPSGFITGISNLVFTTGNQTISGSKVFDTAPTFIDTTVRDSFIFSSLEATEFANPTTLVSRSDLGYSEFSLIICTNGLDKTFYDFDRITKLIDTGDVPITYTYYFPQTDGIIALDSTAVMLNGNQIVNGVKNFTSIPKVNDTGVLLSGSSYITGISGGLQTQITTLNNQTGSYYPRTNPSGYITGVNLSFSGNYYTKNESESRYVNTTGAETILGDKTFHDKVYINNLYVTGLETIINTTNTNVASNYLLLNLTGGAVDGGIFFITGSGFSGINDSGAIIGFDHSDKFKFGIATRASDLSTLDTIASYEEVTGISGSLQTQISTLNNTTGSYALKIETGNFISNSQTGQFYANANPSGFITGINNLVFTTGDQTISGHKDFTSSPTVPLIPTASGHAASKAYVDTLSSTALSNHISDATVHLTSTQNTLLDGITVSAAKVNYLTDVTSNIQGQLNVKQPLDSDLTAIAGLTGTSGLLRKTGTDTWTLDTNTYSVSGHTHGTSQITDLYQPSPHQDPDATSAIMMRGYKLDLVGPRTYIYYEFGEPYLTCVYSISINRWILFDPEVTLSTSTSDGLYPWLATWPGGSGYYSATKYIYPRVAGAPLASAAADGVSNYSARADHVHPFPTALQVGAIPLVGGKIPIEYMPNEADDVLVFYDRSNFPATGQSGKIYLAQYGRRLNDVWYEGGRTYYWDGVYIEVAPLSVYNPSDDEALVAWGNTPNSVFVPTSIQNNRPEYTLFDGRYLNQYYMQYDGNRWIIYSIGEEYYLDSQAAPGTEAYPWLANWGTPDYITRIGYYSYDQSIIPRKGASIGSGGTSGRTARADHVHPLPTAAEIGAASPDDSNTIIGLSIFL